MTVRTAAVSLVLALAGAALAGCAHRETTVTTYTLAHPETRTWVGVRVEDVLRLWGQPAETGSDGEGGKVLTFRSKSSLRVSSGVDDQGRPRERSQPGSGYPEMPAQQVEKEVPRAPSAVFYISPKGVVYRYSINPELLSSGKAPDPPLPDAGEPAPPPE